MTDSIDKKFDFEKEYAKLEAEMRAGETADQREHRLKVEGIMSSLDKFHYTSSEKREIAENQLREESDRGSNYHYSCSEIYVSGHEDD